ncbi:MAG: hypothetical protein Q8L45_11370 [Xanthomonadaceae bacterium]|nr:hypothetical protein [Xanthomonadaceae bacterium]MDP2184463.1 hypothetical protein [Xanthomonadales bacterium]MDZ4115762.1 hypothetical protein [Xanthomonadaceae bacterium]
MRVITLYGKYVSPEPVHQPIHLLACELDAGVDGGRHFRLEIVVLESWVTCGLSSLCAHHNKDLNELAAYKLASDEFCMDCPRERELNVAESFLITGELVERWQCLAAAQHLVRLFAAERVTHNGFHRAETRALFDTPWTTVRHPEWSAMEAAE